MPFGIAAGAVAAGLGAAATGATVAGVAGAALAGAASAGISQLGKSSASGAVSKGVSGANGVATATTGAARDIYQPYMDTGTNALTAYGDFMGLHGQEAADTAMKGFQSSPGYGFQVSEGLRAVDAGAAAKGMLRSGATLKAEQTLGNNLANQDFSNYMTRLNSLTQLGLAGTNSFTNVLNGQANNQQGSIMSGAGAQASIYNAAGQDMSKVVGGLTTQAMTAADKAGWFGGGSSTPAVAAAPPVPVQSAYTGPVF